MEAAAAGGTANPEAPAFPVFVGCRRRLPPDDVLFEAGNMEREQLARQAAVSAARDERRQMSREAELAGNAELADHLHSSHECGRCHAVLPTARLLGIHVAELHDSFFAAQAARRMPVYLCLVDGCSRKFCTVEERKQHLTDHHLFPRNYNFDRMHLRRHKAQIRPLPQFQKGHGRQAMAADADADAEAGGAGVQQQHQSEIQQQQPQQPQQKERQQEQANIAEEGQHAEEALQGLSRLSMAAETSSVPQVVHFGRGRGRGFVKPKPKAHNGQKAAGQAPAPAPAGD